MIDSRTPFNTYVLSNDHILRLDLVSTKSSPDFPFELDLIICELLHDRISSSLDSTIEIQVGVLDVFYFVSIIL